MTPQEALTQAINKAIANGAQPLIEWNKNIPYPATECPQCKKSLDYNGYNNENSCVTCTYTL